MSEQPLYKAQEIDRRLAEITGEILFRLPPDVGELALVPILDGAATAAARIRWFIESEYGGCAPCMGGPSLYDMPIKITRSQGTELVEPRLIDFHYTPADFEGKAVVIIDDLVDEGLTLQMARDVINAHHPAHLLTLAVVKKTDIDTDGWLDYAAFEMGLTLEEGRRNWLYGYGMDLNGEHRDLPDIYCRRVG